jgi:prepilin-type N-terminal cleavage/methylation domain-containing protein
VPARFASPLKYRTHSVRRHARHRAHRAGVTLFELLVVLAILGIITAAVVRQQLPAAPSDRRDQSPDLDRIVDSARQLATRQAVTVSLRVYDDGLWSIVVPGQAEPLAAGTLDVKGIGAMQLTVDPLGACRPVGKWSVKREGTATVWDATRCRWRVPSATGPAT